MKQLLLMIGFLFLLTSLQAQEEDLLEGRWKLLKIEEFVGNGELEDVTRDNLTLSNGGAIGYVFEGSATRVGYYQEFTGGGNGQSSRSKFFYTFRDRKLRIRGSSNQTLDRLFVVELFTKKTQPGKTFMRMIGEKDEVVNYYTLAKVEPRK